MDPLQIIGGLAVLLVAFIAYLRATAALAAADEAKRLGARPSAGIDDGELRQEFEVLKALLAKVAAGEKVTADMIEEGTLWRDITGQEAKELLASDPAPFVLDVRTPQETAGGVAAGAVLIPMDEVEGRKREIPKDGRPILVYCAAGARSAAVCEFLTKEGFSNALNLEGGFGAWPGATEKPKE